MAITGDNSGTPLRRRRMERAADKGEFVLNERESLLDRPERIADQREAIADKRERDLDARARALDVLDPKVTSANAIARDARSMSALSRGEARRLAIAAVEIARSELSRTKRARPLLAQFAVLAKHLHGSPSVKECLNDIVRFTERITPIRQRHNLND